MMLLVTPETELNRIENEEVAEENDIYYNGNICEASTSIISSSMALKHIADLKAYFNHHGKPEVAYSVEEFTNETP